MKGGQGGETAGGKRGGERRGVWERGFVRPEKASGGENSKFHFHFSAFESFEALLYLIVHKIRMIKSKSNFLGTTLSYTKRNKKSNNK